MQHHTVLRNERREDRGIRIKSSISLSIPRPSSNLSSSKSSKSKSTDDKIRAYFSDREARIRREQRSKLHRRNLKAQRDFPFTLETLATIPNLSDSGSEYSSISRSDSVPTSGQSTPEPPPEPIPRGEDLFGYRARPISPFPSTPSTSRSPSPSQAITLSSNSSSEESTRSPGTVVDSFDSNSEHLDTPNSSDS